RGELEEQELEGEAREDPERGPREHVGDDAADGLPLMERALGDLHVERNVEEAKYETLHDDQDRGRHRQYGAPPRRRRDRHQAGPHEHALDRGDSRERPVDPCMGATEEEIEDRELSREDERRRDPQGGTKPRAQRWSSKASGSRSASCTTRPLSS